MFSQGVGFQGAGLEPLIGSYRGRGSGFEV